MKKTGLNGYVYDFSANYDAIIWKEITTFFKQHFFFSDVQIRIMVQNGIYCYINGFLKWNVSKKTSYVVGNKKVWGKICILNLRNKRKSTFARVIIRN